MSGSTASTCTRSGTIAGAAASAAAATGRHAREERAEQAAQVAPHVGIVVSDQDARRRVGGAARAMVAAAAAWSTGLRSAGRTTGEAAPTSLAPVDPHGRAQQLREPWTCATL